MTKKFISTKKAPKPIAPYSQGIKVGNLVFVSGQGPINPETGKIVEGDIRLQAKQTLENIKAILEEAGASLNDVVKVTVFLKDIQDYKAFNEIYGEYFKENPPARTCVQSPQLPKASAVEIDAIAITET